MQELVVYAAKSKKVMYSITFVILPVTKTIFCTRGCFSASLGLKMNIDSLSWPYGHLRLSNLSFPALVTLENNHSYQKLFPTLGKWQMNEVKYYFLKLGCLLNKRKEKKNRNLRYLRNKQFNLKILIATFQKISISPNLINSTSVHRFNEMVVTSTGSILPDLRDFFFHLNHSRHVIFSEQELEFRILEYLNFRTYQLIFTAIQRFLKKIEWG